MQRSCGIVQPKWEHGKAERDTLPAYQYRTLRCLPSSCRMEISLPAEKARFAAKGWNKEAGLQDSGRNDRSGQDAVFVIDTYAGYVCGIETNDSGKAAQTISCHSHCKMGEKRRHR